MTRSIWKGPFVDISIKRNLYTVKNKMQKKVHLDHQVFVWSRRSMILPDFCGQPFHIYNGKKFIICKVSEYMIGHKFGEFSSTRKIPAHKQKNYPKSSKGKR